MAYSLPNGDITFSSGELLASAKMNNFSGNQSNLAAAFSLIHTKVMGLATVADTGDYNDLLNKPTIPVPGNGTLTIKQNGTPIATFKANASGDTDADIVVAGATLYSSTGNNTDGAMTQEAVTDELNNKQDKLTAAQLAILSLNITQAQVDNISSLASDVASLDTDLGNLTTRVTTLETDNTQNKLDISDLQDNKANKGTRLADYGITDAYTADEIDGMLGSVFSYKGSVANMTALNAITGAKTGDTYNVADSGDNYTWDGSGWDKLAGTVDLSSYYTKTETNNGFVAKVTTGSSLRAYTVNASNAQDMTTISTSATANTIAYRTTNGRLTVGTPTANTDAATKKYVDDLLGQTNILNTVYPVGSIYISVNNTNPSTFVGGTWVAFGSGRTLVGVDTSMADFNSAEKTGGSKTHTHTLNNGYTKINIKGNGAIHYREKSVSAWTSNYASGSTSAEPSTDSEQFGAELGGSTDNGSSLQPYITVYMWKRTA